MTGDFGANRKAIQKALYNLSLLERVEEDELDVEESRARKGELGKLTINNIPISESDYGEKAFWLLDLELTKHFFSSPQGSKTAEKVLIFFTCERMYLIMIEMKTTLQPFDHHSGINAIVKKISDTMSRVATLLPYFIFDDAAYKELELRYVALIAYNHDGLSPVLNKSPKLNRDELEIAEIFLENKKSMFIRPTLGKEHRVTFKFIKNPDPGSESMTIDLKELFSDEEGDDYDFSTAIYNEFHCPHQK